MLPPGVNSESCPVFEYAIFNYGLRLGVGSGQYHRKQKSHWMLNYCGIIEESVIALTLNALNGLIYGLWACKYGFVCM